MADETVDTRPLWRRKRFISSVVTVLLAAYLLVGPQLGLPPVPDWVWSAIGATGLTVGGAALKERLAPLTGEEQEGE